MNMWEPKPPSGERGISIGLEGPPGGGKTVSALLLAQGMQDVRGGDIIVIDTENRARKYAGVQIYDPSGKPVGRPLQFLVVDFPPPFRANRFKEAIAATVLHKPACIIVDSISDEHDGEGGRLDWHEEVIDDILIDKNRNVPDYDPRARSQQGARYALALEGWQEPSSARKRLAQSINRIGATPLILCFRAEAKTKPIKVVKNGREIFAPTNIGFVPIAPDNIVHALDIVCLLPARSDGLPLWRSDKLHQDFVLKLPQQFRQLLKEGQRITPDVGAALARWAKGNDDTPTETVTRREEPSDRNGSAGLRKTFPQIMEEIVDSEGERGLREARAAAEAKGHSTRLEWIDTNWIELLERAKAVDVARRTAPESEPALPNL
jgi:hypothetical protein